MFKLIEVGDIVILIVLELFDCWLLVMVSLKVKIVFLVILGVVKLGVVLELLFNIME